MPLPALRSRALWPCPRCGGSTARVSHLPVLFESHVVAFASYPGWQPEGRYLGGVDTASITPATS